MLLSFRSDSVARRREEWQSHFLHGWFETSFLLARPSLRTDGRDNDCNTRSTPSERVGDAVRLKDSSAFRFDHPLRHVRDFSQSVGVDHVVVLRQDGRRHLAQIPLEVEEVASLRADGGGEGGSQLPGTDLLRVERFPEFLS